MSDWEPLEEGNEDVYGQEPYQVRCDNLLYIRFVSGLMSVSL